MVLGYHVTISAYGFWLPNDPRGSWSDFVRKWELVRYGKATKVTTRRSVARVEHDQALRRAAKAALDHPPVEFTGRQALAAAHGFDQARRESGYVIHACCILPAHAHLVLARHERDIRRIAGHLKGRATQTLAAEGLWFADNRPVWGNGSWNVFLNTDDEMCNAIRYVENNPLKEGKPRQHWNFVVPYGGI